MIMDKTRQSKLEESNRFIKIYLWVFLIYIVLFLSSSLYEHVFDYLYGQQDWEFSLSGTIAAVSTLFFTIYNIIMLILFCRKRNSRLVFYLSLSELIYLLGLFILPTFTSLFSSVYLLYIVKIAQLIFIIYLLFKYKR